MLSYEQIIGTTVVKKIRWNPRFVETFKPKTAYTAQPTHDSRISYSSSDEYAISSRGVGSSIRRVV